MSCMGEEIPVSSAAKFRRQAAEFLAAAQTAINEATRLMLKADELEGKVVAHPVKFTEPN
jgi:hypothetical protein